MTDVFVVAPIRVHRESLSLVLSDATDLHIIGEASTMTNAFPRLLGAEVTVLDAPGPEELDLLVRAPVPEVKLVAVGVPDEEAIEWIEAGVSGYVNPEASLDDLAAAVARVARGEIVISVEVQAHLLSRIRRLAAVPNEAEDARLTSRETEVLSFVAEGLSNKLIAKRLSVQEQTIKNHMHNILRKLGVNNRGEAVVRMRHWRQSARR